MVWVFLNGEYILESQGVIPISDRGFLFGDGCFTTLRVFQGEVEFFSAHLQRLYEHCHQLRLDCPRIEEEWIKELIVKNRAFEGVWKLKIIVTGGNHPDLHLPRRPHGQLVMLLHPYQVQGGGGSSSCRLCVCPHVIEKPTSCLKSLSYLDRLYVKQYALDRGYEDAIVLSSEGDVLETAFSNIFWFDGHTLSLPHPDLPYLRGVILTHLSQHSPFALQYVKGALEEIPAEAAVYLCNAMTHIRPVDEIEGRKFSRQPAWDRELAKMIGLARVG